MSVLSKERLTDNFKQLVACGPKTCGDICETHELSCKYCVVQQAFNKLAEYEDLEEQGLLLRLPFCIGQRVYFISKSFIDGSLFVASRVYSYSCLDGPREYFGTKSEAEEKLRELEGK